MRKLRLTVVAVFLLATTASLRAQPSVDATVGGARLTLPVPQGFEDPSYSVPVLRRNAEAVTPPAMRLLAVFVDEQDRKAVQNAQAPYFKRYFMVQVLRAKEGDSLTATAFSGIKHLVIGVDSATISRVQDHVSSAGKQMGKDSGMELSLDIGIPRQLGVFHETPYSVSTMLVTRTSASNADRALERLVGQATTAALIRGKVVFFTAYSEASSDSDYHWLRTVSQEWVALTVAANQ
jgi:hypothetical protein